MSTRAAQRRDKAIKRLLELAPQMLFGSSSQTYRTCGPGFGPLLWQRQLALPHDELVRLLTHRCPASARPPRPDGRQWRGPKRRTLPKNRADVAHA